MPVVHYRDFLTYSRETWFPFSYGEVLELIGLIVASKEIEKVSKFNNSLSFGVNQNALQQICFAYDFLKIYLQKILIDFFSSYYDFN